MEPSSVEDGNPLPLCQRVSVELTSMEPSSVEDGNESRPSVARSGPQKLQWSRPQLRTETRRTVCRVSNRFFTSMEPSSVEDGNLLQLQRDRAGRDTSMEPSSVEDGNRIGACFAGLRDRTSMEPSSVEDGNTTRPQGRPWQPSNFNGAVLS